MLLLVAAAGPADPPILRRHLAEPGPPLARPILPPAFRGHWSEIAAACRQPPIEENQLWISGGSLGGYEVAGRLTRVSLDGRRHAVVTARTDGEGLVFVARHELFLSRDGRTLTVADEDDTGRRRFHRCPR